MQIPLYHVYSYYHRLMMRLLCCSLVSDVRLRRISCMGTRSLSKLPTSMNAFCLTKSVIRSCCASCSSHICKMTRRLFYFFLPRSGMGHLAYNWRIFTSTSACFFWDSHTSRTARKSCGSLWPWEAVSCCCCLSWCSCTHTHLLEIRPYNKPYHYEIFLCCHDMLVA